MPVHTPIHISVLLVPPTQLLDVSPIDLFAMLTEPYLSICFLPAPIIAGSVPLSISYVSEAGPDHPAECTANAGLRVTASLDDEIASPAKTQILLIPGPDPSTVPSEKVKTFVREHAAQGTVVMTVCTGAYLAGYAGILDGKQATGPRSLLPDLKSKFPRATWEERRWTSQGNVWCSAGITNGLDMVATYIRETWPGPTAEAVLAIADVGARSVEYET
ncbi:hypothetical protein MMC13_004042 [Lambiella insularis]|nr:hypothetical protein [Lambiella insularis]